MICEDPRYFTDTTSLLRQSGVGHHLVRPKSSRIRRWKVPCSAPWRISAVAKQRNSLWMCCACCSAVKGASISLKIRKSGPLRKLLRHRPPFCTRYLQHARPFVYGPSGNVVKLTHFSAARLGDGHLGDLIVRWLFLPGNRNPRLFGILAHRCIEGGKGQSLPRSKSNGSIDD